MQKRIAYRVNVKATVSDKQGFIKQLQNHRGVEGLVVDFLLTEDEEWIWVLCVPGYTDSDGVPHILLAEREQVEDVLADYATCVGISQADAFKRFAYDALYAEEIYALRCSCEENSKEV